MKTTQKTCSKVETIITHTSVIFFSNYFNNRESFLQIAKFIIDIASNLNPDSVDETDSESEWDELQPKAEPQRMSAFDDNPFEDKTIQEYEKGFHYGTNKAKLDEQMENAILKSEIYGDPASINQYRYYGGSDDRRRKRSKKIQINNAT